MIDGPAPEVIKLMADRDLCEPCATRLANLESGMAGTWICAACSARHAAKDAAEEAARKALGHPAPWRWDGEDFGDLTLRDATGNWVADGGANGVGIAVPSPYAKAIIAAAPEMRDALLKLDAARRERGDNCPECGCKADRHQGCQYGALLARIDEAAKV